MGRLWRTDEKEWLTTQPTNASSMEVIDAIDGSSAEGFCVGSIIKYVTRYKHKNGVEDLKKAKWYIDYLISSYENN